MSERLGDNIRKSEQQAISKPDFLPEPAGYKEAVLSGIASPTPEFAILEASQGDEQMIGALKAQIQIMNADETAALLENLQQIKYELGVKKGYKNAEYDNLFSGKGVIIPLILGYLLGESIVPGSGVFSSMAVTGGSKYLDFHLLEKNKEEVLKRTSIVKQLIDDVKKQKSKSTETTEPSAEDNL